MNKQKDLVLDDLNKSNIWTLCESELSYLLIEGKKQEYYAEMETHYMNIIRTVFDIQFLNRKDEHRIAQLEQQRFEIFSWPSEGDNNAIAIRKRPIKKVTDLTLENIQHLDPLEVLELLRNNMGTGWKGLSLSIQDIIESAFFVDCSVLPEATMHRPGGIIDRRKEDGYEVLELERGGWIEAVFIKAKPKVEKTKMDFSINDSDDSEREEDDDEDLTLMPEENDVDEEEDDEINEENAEIEDIEALEVEDDEDE